MTTVRAVVRKWRAGGTRDVTRRVVRRLYERTGAGALEFPLDVADVTSSAGLVLTTPPPTGDPDRRLSVGWVCSAPAPGSGGHTTFFRMAQAFEDAGHRCVLLLHDPHHGDLREQEQVIRAAWPWLRAEVRAVPAGPSGFTDLDAVVASSWDSAHVVAARAREPIHRFYFVQDYEPFFVARGYEQALAEDSYRFGLNHIALGAMVAGRLAGEIGVASHEVPFSVDTAVYSLRNRGPRSGVVFYAKPGVARRGYQLGAQALGELHRLHPEQEIHVYGDPTPDLAVPHTHHGRLTPAQLDELYNSCVTGLGLSFTNVSLVPDEMLASGCVPVVNDCADARACLDHPAVVWAPPTPIALAAAMSSVIRAEDPDARTAYAATRPASGGWADTGRQVVGIVADQVSGPGARLAPGRDGDSAASDVPTTRLTQKGR